MDLVQYLIGSGRVSTRFLLGQISLSICSLSPILLSQTSDDGPNTWMIEVVVTEGSPVMSILQNYLLSQRLNVDLGSSPRNPRLINGANKQLRTTLTIAFERPPLASLSLSEINELIRRLQDKLPNELMLGQLICLLHLIVCPATLSSVSSDVT
jgi:hypothetical protein